jgi:hypothetical protein
LNELAKAPAEDRGLLPIIGYQLPLSLAERDPVPRYKLVFLMPITASAPLNARLSAPPRGCTVVPEVTSAETGAVVVNLRLQWTNGYEMDSSPCRYDATTAKEAHVLVEGIAPDTALVTDGPIVEADHEEIEPAQPGNKVPQLVEQLPTGG